MASLCKVLLMSRHPSPPGNLRPGQTIAVLGNGPSLKEALEEQPVWLTASARMAVNFAANTDEIRSLQPEYYVLADPHFFKTDGKDPNVKELWCNLRATGWKMTLYVPVKRTERAKELLDGNRDVTVKGFNMTPAEGWRRLCRLLYATGLAMPRPRNVLVPAIMLALREGYRKIYLTGADHSWLQSLYVDHENHVVSVQPHFYEDNEEEKKRVTSEYAGYHLHDILGSMTVAFRSYFEIADYARTLNAEIINATPGSYIDAFRRLSRKDW